MKSAKLFGMRIPFWTKAQEKKAQREKENKEKRLDAIAAQLKRDDRYWQAIARRAEKERYQEIIAKHLEINSKNLFPTGDVIAGRIEMQKKIDFPVIKFPGDSHE